MRAQGRKSAEDRRRELQDAGLFRSVQDEFGRLVVVLEGDVVKENFGWPVLQAWPYPEPLRVCLHSAADVDTHMSMQQATVSIVSAALQVAKLAASWRAERYVFVSTGFLPSSSGPLPESLLDLQGFAPMDLYRDAVGDGRWAREVMRALDVQQPYPFAKALAEHLTHQFCLENGLEPRIVRPAALGPAWSRPWPGWCHARLQHPFAFSADALSLHPFWLLSSDPTPAVPVDFAVDVLIAAALGQTGTVAHAAINSADSHNLPKSSEVLDMLLEVSELSSLSAAVQAAAFRGWQWCIQSLPAGAAGAVWARVSPAPWNLSRSSPGLEGRLSGIFDGDALVKKNVLVFASPPTNATHLPCNRHLTFTHR